MSEQDQAERPLHYVLYICEWEEWEGPVTDLMRLVDDGEDIWGEEYILGEWYDSEAPFLFSREPPFYGNYLSEAEAMELITSGKLDKAQRELGYYGEE